VTTPRVGDRVRVRDIWPPGHVRTPGYVRGRVGTVVAVRGPFQDPEALAYGRPGLPRRLCTVRFRQRDLWPEYVGGPHDSLQVDIFEHWLEQGD